MIDMDNLLDMVCTESRDGDNGDTCQDFALYGIELSPAEIAEYHACKRAYRKTWSLKRRAREQRRLDWASRVRRRKRRAELEARHG